MDPLPGQLGFDLDDLPADDRPVVSNQIEFASSPAANAVALTAGYWRAFSADHPRADALARFRQRFGRDPEQVRQDRGILLLGPV